ncbi:MAG: 3-phosphoglycerate dehydrogenase [Rhodospirillales bacterium 70-18]|nr:hydroxyacid dehydrogenase [Rhodospirillales bacterium]OJY65389.1 MAG: 3-phosphoglycerate dehydrogenase [Rhodospirillales bacterium 70-18]
MTANRKKILLPTEMARAGWAVLEGRDDIAPVAFGPEMSGADFQGELATASAVALWGRPFTAADVAAAPHLQAVGRIGVGYDAVDVPALTARAIPLLIAGTANSVTVAEHALFFMFWLAKQGAALDRVVRDGDWPRKYVHRIFDLYGKTVLIVGFGRIGTRLAARCLALEMTVLVHDPFTAQDGIAARGCIPAPDLDAALARADFVSIHCPKKPDTVGLFNAARLARMKSSAFLVNTARGGIIDEPALYDALVAGRLAGAGLDVFEQEPTPADNPLLRLPNVIAAPHMAGVTQEALDRMAVNTVRNLLSVLDGRPERENVVNKDVLAGDMPG